MPQYATVTRPIQRYTRSDFTALRAMLNKLPLDVIMGMYFDEDDLLERKIESPADLGIFLNQMRDHLANRAREANPNLAGVLEDARKFGVWTKSVIDYITQSAEKTETRPMPGDSLSVWLKPRVAKHLKTEGIGTLAELTHWINYRGKHWWRPIPRLGVSKAAAIERWLMGHADTLGPVNPAEVVVPANAIELTSIPGQFVTLERIRQIESSLAGAQGRNRNHMFPLISARNDLEAVQAYLYRFRDKEKTHRSYQKELERFLLWCVKTRQIPLSGILNEDCEAYKDFLAAVPDAWIGPKTFRHSTRWRPFAGQLEPTSQRYAVQALRTFFKWLVDVRYLTGNPWATVVDPSVAKKITPLDIEKALPEATWRRLAGTGGLLDMACARNDDIGRQARLARAVILLMGTTGLRREEAANATRNNLKPLPGQPTWSLDVLGKRNKWRMVILPPRTIAALRAHWQDRGHDFDQGLLELALLSPVIVPTLPKAQTKHLAPDGSLKGTGFAPSALYPVVKGALDRLANDPDIELAPEDRDLLRAAAPHALRHTFATLAATVIELPELQSLLGHASLSTTTIYVQAERARLIQAGAKLAAEDL